MGTVVESGRREIGLPLLQARNCMRKKYVKLASYLSMDRSCILILKAEGVAMQLFQWMIYANAHSCVGGFELSCSPLAGGSDGAPDADALPAAARRPGPHA